MRKICYVSGTRADFGLMCSLLLGLKNDPDFDLSICVTAMHLSALYGLTINEIKAQNFRLAGEIEVDVDTAKPETMSKSIGQVIIGITDVFLKEKPDLILLLGDRGETLAAAIAAVHLNIPIVHIHGGERSGTVDEMVRHAISKFSHYHFVATKSAAERLAKMGELEDKVYVVGAPGLDDIVKHKPCGRQALCEKFNFDASKPLALLIFHPVVQEYDDLSQQMFSVLTAALDCNFQLICLEPNADAGGHEIRKVLYEYRNHPSIRLIKHLERSSYLDCLASVDFILGNSSSGIIEAASFSKIVLNIGSRQNLRERGDNVIDVGVSKDEIMEGLKQVMSLQHKEYTNVYGDGKTSERCCLLLKSIPLNSDLLSKSNAY